MCYLAPFVKPLSELFCYLFSNSAPFRNHFRMSGNNTQLWILCAPSSDPFSAITAQHNFIFSTGNMGTRALELCLYGKLTCAFEIQYCIFGRIPSVITVNKSEALGTDTSSAFQRSCFVSINTPIYCCFLLGKKVQRKTEWRLLGCYAVSLL
jgi:hypothetical protein